MKRILCVSYDKSLLVTRRMLLESQGYSVTVARGFEDSVKAIRQHDFDLFLLGHSIPEADQQAMVEVFRKCSTGTVLSLRRSDEDVLPGADYYEFPDQPERLLQLVAKIMGGARDDLLTG